MGNRTRNDHEIQQQLAAGSITTDPTTGHVIRLRHGGRRVAGRPNNNGYLQISLGGKTVLVHRIVWIDANGPIPEDLEINHKNHDRTDNRLSNLELVTHAENIAHARSRVPSGDFVEMVQMDDLDPEWLEQVLALANDPDATPDQVAALHAQVP